MIFEREAPLDIRITEARILAMVGQEIGSRETVTFKILLRGISDEEPEQVKLEISTESDYFFLFMH